MIDVERLKEIEEIVGVVIDKKDAILYQKMTAILKEKASFS